MVGPSEFTLEVITAPPDVVLGVVTASEVPCNVVAIVEIPRLDVAVVAPSEVTSEVTAVSEVPSTVVIGWIEEAWPGTVVVPW